jgi:hypothetical protein
MDRVRVRSMAGRTMRRRERERERERSIGTVCIDRKCALPGIVKRRYLRASLFPTARTDSCPSSISRALPLLKLKDSVRRADVVFRAILHWVQ